MKKILDIISEEVQTAFEKAGYPKEAGKVSISNRPDLCEYQCNGALSLAKQLKMAPIKIAEAVASQLTDSKVLKEVQAVMPGFLNMNITDEFLTDYVGKMGQEENFGLESPGKPLKIVIDYGGPNVAKPLHVGHLRPAIIGESIKRIARYAGHEVIGDVHLGDWGLPMGLIIEELKERQPDLPYFDENFTGEYPKEAPFTVTELEEIYPFASAKSKENEEFRNRALEATCKLQQKHRGYYALWKQITSVSVNDLKKNYEKLDVEFDLWKAESDVDGIIPGMIEQMKKDGYAYFSDGALVVDVKEDTDTKEMPPCILLKSNGSALYGTTDVATIKERMDLFNPDMIIYVVDKRQDLHFEQVFRCVRKTHIVDENVKLISIGFGTMNGKDGKPFKTRDGGVMRLEYLMGDINDEMLKKIKDNRDISDEEAKKTAKIVGLSAIKYGDLSNQPSKDYVFDMDRFTSFEGDTGPYILYTIVRIKSILAKYCAEGGSLDNLSIGLPHSETQKQLMKDLTGFSATIESAFADLLPNRVCSYIFELCNSLNSFYHETKILSEEDENLRSEYIALIELAKRNLEDCIHMLGFDAPDRM